jgi:sterol desaturase/sphingolipid hydroxylase (fatty acid hydroxylase superfamily)
METINELWLKTVAASSELAVVSLAFLLLGLIRKGNLIAESVRRSWIEARLNILYHYLDWFLVFPLVALVVASVSFLMTTAGLVLVAQSAYEGLPVTLTLMITIGASDFVGYWRHRLMHTSLLWPVHSVHHSDTAVTWTTLARFHPINRLVTTAVDTAFLACLGFPPAIIALSDILRHFHGYYVHTNVDWTHGPLRRLFVSPLMHRWHHVRDVKGSGSNFASVFSIFDVIFGTFRMPDEALPALGVAERGYPSQWLGQTLYPFRVWTARLLAR